MNTALPGRLEACPTCGARVLVAPTAGNPSATFEPEPSPQGAWQPHDGRMTRRPDGLAPARQPQFAVHRCGTAELRPRSATPSE